MTVVRKSITKLDDVELDKLIHAFHEIQKADPGEPGNPNLRSFQVIAGLHGQPFRGAGYGNSAWWGGYCHHGNVLFPTWHRAYLLHLERALQSVPGCQDVALPYWDEMEGDNWTPRIPRIFLQQRYTFNDKSLYGTEPIDNPLYSYTLQQGFFDKLARYIEAPKTDQKDSDKMKRGKLQDYGKYRGYKTVRCPYSGLVGKDDLKDTIQHNWLIDSMGMGYADKILNENIARWQETDVRRNPYGANVEGAHQDYLRCLEAPNYTVFSNTTSAGKWNDDKISQVGRPDYDPGKLDDYVVPLERPHNSMHLAVGGHDFPNRPEPREEFQGANGDMGENDSASFDPIFFFHHCFVDLVFWSWQEYTRKKIEIIQDYPGTSSVDDQGPTPKMAADSALDENTPLYPFREDPIEENGRFLTSVDVASTRHLGYTYDKLVPKKDNGHRKADAVPFVRVSGIDRSLVKGSFAISVWTGKELVGYEPVFSRWHVGGCSNCQNSLYVTSFMPIPSHITKEGDEAKRKSFAIKIHLSEEETIKKKTKDIGGKDVDIWKRPRLDIGKLRMII